MGACSIAAINLGPGYSVSAPRSPRLRNLNSITVSQTTHTNSEGRERTCSKELLLLERASKCRHSSVVSTTSTTDDDDDDDHNKA